jgi:hypothetical protein
VGIFFGGGSDDGAVDIGGVDARFVVERRPVDGPVGSPVFGVAVAASWSPLERVVGVDASPVRARSAVGRTGFTEISPLAPCGRSSRPAPREGTAF